MTHFADQLTHRIHQLNNPTVVGLDPRLNQIPEFIRKKSSKQFSSETEAAAHAILEFNKGIIEAVADIVPAVKPQIAFYECFGPHGLWAYQETVKAAKSKGLLVIGDVKRGDIGTTAEAYAQAHLGGLEMAADAVTVVPFFGTDGIRPFTEMAKKNDRGVFIMVRSSNPSADEIQGQTLGDHLMDEHIAGLVEGWGRDLIGESGFSLVGAVVGATYPEEARTLRQLMPNQIFLVPGYGAQGGAAQDVKACFHANGTGAIVNSSRGIIFAYEKSGDKQEAYAEAARKAALQMKKELAELFSA
ncbi:MAG: orotidine-5'-phosphate decarboxylase [Candidatus Peregrinibacteria bacterium]